MTLQAIAVTPTLTFQNPVPLTAGGIPIDLGNHAATKLVDWNGDGSLDLLVGAGDGYIWCYLQAGATNSTDFMLGNRVLAAGIPVRAGTGYSGACFSDIDGDGMRDLIIAGNDNRVRYFHNFGTPFAPIFSESIVIPGVVGDLVLPSGVGGRIDVADWDSDGLQDLITGQFDGFLTWHRNSGTTNAPAFGFPGEHMALNGSPIQEAYNTHPKVVDLNQDGRVDVAYGINWGYFKVLLRPSSPSTTNFFAAYILQNTNGSDLNIRTLNGDDTTPDFGDLDGDGVLDLISGGLNGKLFIMRGVSSAPALSRIEFIMATHTNNLGAVLASDSALRDELFGLHRGIRNLTTEFLPLVDRESVRDWYRAHIARYPQYLQKRHLDQTSNAFVPYLAGQVWVNLYESIPDSLTHRQETAQHAGLTGVHSNLLVDLGILYIENSSSSTVSQQAVYDLAKNIPAELQIVERITQDDYLRPPAGGSVNIASRGGGVNVFAQVGDYTEGFPSEVPATLIDGFSVVVAHELNHNVDVAAQRIYPWFQKRKYRLLEQAAPPHLIFLNQNTQGLGLDLTATQSNFLAHALWDGVPAHWPVSYDAYWSSGPGYGFERHWLRDNLKLCIDAPQEAFATLANQYFTSSEIMLQLALVRWQTGITNCINQFLFIVDTYSLGSDHTYFYRVNTAAQVTRAVVYLQRNESGHLCGLTVGGIHYDFDLDVEGNVIGLLQTPVTAVMPTVQLFKFPGDLVHVSSTTPANYRIILETTSNLLTWKRLYTNNPFSGPLLYVDSHSTNMQRFYRLHREW